MTYYISINYASRQKWKLFFKNVVASQIKFENSAIFNLKITFSIAFVPVPQDSPTKDSTCTIVFETLI